MREITAYLAKAAGLAMLLATTVLGPAQTTMFSVATTYTVTELATLGGTVGAAESINDQGLVAGFANLPGNRTEHAVRWINGTITDLGTLGGPNSSVGFPAKNSQGMLVGFSQTTDSDPLREGWNYFCGPSGVKSLCEGKNLITLGFVWQNGSMTSLRPFRGGNISEAFGINNFGQVVGLAETGNTDPTCVRPQELDYVGVIWNADGSMQALHPFPGDLISAAVGINNNGQVVGASGPCAPVSPSIGAHALLWQNASVTATDLGNLEVARTMSLLQSMDKARSSASLVSPATLRLTRFFGRMEGPCRIWAHWQEMSLALPSASTTTVRL